MEILFASSNKGKIGQFQFVADSLGYPAKIVSVYEKFPEIKTPSEEHNSADELVAKNAKEIFEKAKMPVVIEDSTIEIEAFGKGPGVRSEKYLKEKKLTGLLEEMKGRISRKAKMVSTITHYNGSNMKILKNSVEGHIAEKISFREGEPLWVGPFGGGFNAVFVHRKKKKTIADMTAEECLAYGYAEPNFRSVLKHIFGY